MSSSTLVVLYVSGLFFVTVSLVAMRFRRQITAWNDRTAVRFFRADPARANAAPAVKHGQIGVLAVGVVILVTALCITVIR